MKDLTLYDFDFPGVKDGIIGMIKPLAGLYWFQCWRARDQRSLKQNAYMWSVVLPLAAQGISEVWDEDINAEEAHEFFKREYLAKPIINRRTGELKGYTSPSTANLDKAEFAQYLEKIIKFCAENLGVEIPPAKIDREEAA